MAKLSFADGFDGFDGEIDSFWQRQLKLAVLWCFVLAEAPNAESYQSQSLLGALPARVGSGFPSDGD